MILFEKSILLTYNTLIKMYLVCRNTNLKMSENDLKLILVNSFYVLS